MFNIILADGRLLGIVADEIEFLETLPGLFLLKNGRRVAYIPEGYILYEEASVQ